MIGRPKLIYYSMMFIALFLYGHHDKVIELSNKLIPTINCLWSIRNRPVIYFFTSLAIIARIRESGPDPKESKTLLDLVAKYKEQIENWQTVCDVNYRGWSLLLDAELYEVQQHYHSAIQAYEATIDHALLYDFHLDLAMAFELQGYVLSQDRVPPVLSRLV